MIDMVMELGGLDEDGDFSVVQFSMNACLFLGLCDAEDAMLAVNSLVYSSGAPRTLSTSLNCVTDPPLHPQHKERSSS